MLRLLGTLPDQLSASRTDGRSRIRRGEFIPGDIERCFSVDAVPIREGTAHDVRGNRFISLAHRVRAEVGKTPLHDGLFFSGVPD